MHPQYLSFLAMPMICLSLIAQADQRYEVQRGDTLSALAERFYGDLESWRLIYRANREKVFDGGHLVAIGTTLIIPDLSKDQSLAAREGSAGDAKNYSGGDSRISMARPATLLLDNGLAFFGTIVGTSGDGVLIRRGVRTFRIALGEVKGVRLESKNGGVIAGELLGWDNGVFDLRSNSYRLAVQDGEIISARVLPRGHTGAAIETVTSTRDVVIGDTPVIRLNNGKQIKGYVVDFVRPVVTVRRGSRGSNRIKLADIAEIEIATAEGVVVTGELVDWADGIYRLQASDRTIVARESIVPIEVAPTVVADLPSPPDAVEADQSAQANTEARSLEDTAIDGSTPSEVRVRTTADAVVPPSAEAAPSQGGVLIQPVRGSVETRQELVLDQAAGVGGDDVGVGGGFIPIAELVPGDDEVIMIKARALPAREGDDALRFEINLSRTPDEKLVVVYASVDGTATSGEDFYKQSGVLDIQPGEVLVTIDLPLIDDEEVELDETVYLFISPDPSRAKVDERDIVGLIQNDDDG